jgi:imidazolonepropionase-like amidohydrolase
MSAMHVHGRVLPDDTEQDVFIHDDGHFTFTPLEDARTMVRDAFLIPGLVDVHCHLGLNSGAPDDASEHEQVRASARIELAAGVLAVREPGSINHASKGLGPREGLPTTITAGRFLAPIGGYFPGIAREVGAGELSDAALEELSHGDGWVKLIGDFFGDGGVMRPNFEPDVLGSAVARVHEAGGRVAVHTVIRETIEMALDAGVDSIEHGTGITEVLLERMRVSHTAWVPTLLIYGGDFAQFLHDMGAPPSEIARITEGIDHHPAMVHAADQGGVRVLAGTDAGMVDHGLILEELIQLRAAGLPGERALAAASWDARDFLGLPSIVEQAPADLAAYSRDPRDDPTVLREPSLVLLHGRQIVPSKLASEPR